MTYALLCPRTLRSISPVVVASLALSACSGSGGTPPVAEVPVEVVPEAPPVPERTVSEDTPHLLFITLDTLRADRLGSYGYDKAQTDSLDALASAGRRYERTYAPVPLTIPAHTAMFSGRYPAKMGMRQNGDAKLEDDVTTLAEVLSSQGWNTGAAVAAFVTTRVWGFDQGFNTFMDDIPTDAANFWHGMRPGQDVVDEALAWKAEQDPTKPMFLWVHLYDAHFPYFPPKPYLDAAEGRPYDAEVALVDDLVGQLVAGFEGEPTLTVVVGDHGEGLNDHDELTHGLFVHEVSARVPFLMQGPGVDPEVVTQPVAMVDVMPIVLETLDLPVPEGLDGAVPPSEGEGTAPRPIYVESYQLARRFGIAPHVAVIDGNMKLIDLPEPELYDVAADPGESNNLAAARPDEVARLREVRASMDIPLPADAGEVQGLPEDTTQALAALGYVEPSSAVDLSTASDGSLPDPKRRKELITQSQLAERARLLHRTDEERGLLAKLVADYPDILEFQTRFVVLTSNSGTLDEQTEALQAALEVFPDHVPFRVHQATLLAKKGDFSGAAARFGDLAIDAPDLPRIRTMTVAALRQAGQREAAAQLSEGYLLDHPDDASLAGMLGVIAIEEGKLEEGLPLLAKGMEIDQPEFGVQYYLAAKAMLDGNKKEGLALLRSEVEDHPRNERARRALMDSAFAAQNWEELGVHAQALLATGIEDAFVHYMAVLAAFNQDQVDEAQEALDRGLALDPKHPWLMLMKANLQAKRGNVEAGTKTFAAAKAALAARREELQRVMAAQRAQLGGDPGSGEVGALTGE